MGVYNYYPKNTSGQTFGIATYVPTVKNMMCVVLHGKGECGDGGLSILTTISKWGDTWDGGWKYLKLNADKYGIVLVWVNTTNPSFFGSGEIDFALNWAMAKFPTIPESKTWGLGHSLGGRGWMMFFYTELAKAKRLAGCIVSAAGPYPYSDQFQNIIDAGAKFWCVTATNDTASGTAPIYTRDIYDKTKALNPAAHVIISEFPTGTWSSSAAHNSVLTKLTRDPIEVTPAITRGIVAGLPIKMNIYQWMLSNVRGSTYQDPTLFYSGPKYVNVTIVDVNYDVRKGLALIHWSNGDFTSVAAPSGDSILNFFHRLDSSGRQLTTVDFNLAVSKTYGPLK